MVLMRKLTCISTLELVDCRSMWNGSRSATARPVTRRVSTAQNARAFNNQRDRVVSAFDGYRWTSATI